MPTDNLNLGACEWCGFPAVDNAPDGGGELLCRECLATFDTTVTVIE